MKRKAPSTAWKPGQSGNPAGKKPGQTPAQLADAKLGETVRELLAQPDEDGVLRLQVMIIAQYNKAKNGDTPACKLLLDRGFGTPIETREFIVGHDASESTLAKWLEEMSIAPKRKAT